MHVYNVAYRAFQMKGTLTNKSTQVGEAGIHFDDSLFAGDSSNVAVLAGVVGGVGGGLLVIIIVILMVAVVVMATILCGKKEKVLISSK